MKTLGLLGGMSWESTIPYYRLINEAVRDRCGGLHSARLLLSSVDFAPIEIMMREGRWGDAGEHLGNCAAVLERAGAEGRHRRPEQQQVPRRGTAPHPR